jgi:hypothetical protein
MEMSSQIAWKIVPFRHFFPLKVVPLIGIFLYIWIVAFIAAAIAAEPHLKPGHLV